MGILKYFKHISCVDFNIIRGSVLGAGKVPQISISIGWLQYTQIFLLKLFSQNSKGFDLRVVVVE